ncbi:MAG TPA: DUF4421 family protein [Salinivirgaceae bacterium]|nr:DUF4421 family protein [Salinivirgaceae bacterium]
MIRIAFLLVFITIGFNISAKSLSHFPFKSKEVDTAYIASFNDKLIAGIYIPHKFVNFSTLNVSSGKLIEYQPNSRLNMGLEASYKWFGFGLAYSLPSSRKSSKQLGDTKSIDFQYNFNLRRWSIDGYFQLYKGFYFSNMSDYFDLWDYDNDYPKSDLKIGNYGVVANYIVNYDKFSYQAVFNFNEKQKKSVGSLILGTFVFYNTLNADTTFIPDFAIKYFQDISQLNNMGTISFGATVGYTHTFVFKKYFCINMSLIPGYGVYSNSACYDDGTPIEKGLKSAFFFQSRVSFLYQKNNFYACFSGITGTQTSISKSPYSFSFGHGQTELSVGYRFNAHKLSNSKLFR